MEESSPKIVEIIIALSFFVAFYGLLLAAVLVFCAVQPLLSI